MNDNNKIKLALEFVKENPNIDIDKFMALIAADYEKPTKTEEVTLTDIKTEKTPKSKPSAKKRYTYQELKILYSMYQEFDCAVINIPKNRILGLSSQTGRTYKAILSQLYRFQEEKRNG